LTGIKEAQTIAGEHNADDDEYWQHCIRCREAGH
jgi:hypothetical protein